MPDSLQQISSEIIHCARCPRLVEYRERMAREKRRAYRDWEYWGKPVPGFGDPRARLLVIGLAPAAHGGNRTGRVFTGDSSGDLLYRTLHATGFASQPQSISRDDGLGLRDAWITATVRCAPPANKPLPREARNCRPFLERELNLLGRKNRLRAVVCLGRIAFDSYLSILRDADRIVSPSEFHFAHGAVYRFENFRPALPALIASYHPSRQNTQTGRLIADMFLSIFQTARRLLDSSADLSKK